MSVTLFAGWLLLVGGSLGVWSSLQSRRDPGWRGTLLSAAGLTLYGALVVSGVVPGRTALAAAAVWVVAGVVFAGLVIGRRDRRKARQAR